MNNQNELKVITGYNGQELLDLLDQLISKGVKIIGTHSGVFHSDEALACFLLLNYTNDFKDAVIVRSRDPKVWERCTILVDVGGKYDPDKLHFDHHQRGFNEPFYTGNVIKMSSAGMVYKHFWHAIFSVMRKSEGWDWRMDFTTKFRDLVYNKFFQEVDADDNGINQYPDGGRPLFQRVTMASEVRRLNPQWNEEGVDPNERFKDAMELMGKHFRNCVHDIVMVWLPARSLVGHAMQHRQNRTVRLDKYCPWEKHLFELENDLSVDPDDSPLYVIYEGRDGNWALRTVPEHSGSFDPRAPFPEPWRGLSGKELSEVVGLDGCVFCHGSGFIFIGKTKEVVEQVMAKALEEVKEKEVAEQDFMSEQERNEEKKSD